MNKVDIEIEGSALSDSSGIEVVFLDEAEFEIEDTWFIDSPQNQASYYDGMDYLTA